MRRAAVIGSWISLTVVGLCALTGCGGRVVVARELGLEEADAGVSSAPKADAGPTRRRPLGPSRSRLRKPPDPHGNGRR